MGFESSLPLPHALTGALRRLAQLAYTSSWDQWHTRRLTPSQRRILTFLGSRDESPSLKEMAHELGVTASTVCDSIGALQRKNLVCKQRSNKDGRAISLVLTEGGQQSAKHLAELPDPLCSAFDTLDESEQQALYHLSIKMIRGLEESGALPKSRTCVRCKFFDPFRFAGSPTPHHCDRAEMPLAESQVRIDCAIFVAADEAGQVALWQKFVAQSFQRDGSR